MKKIKKILVAANGSLDLVRECIQLAKDEKAWITVLKVTPSFEGYLNKTGIKKIRKTFPSKGNDFVSDVQQIANETGALIKTRVETGKINRKIVDVAHEERCDLIIMGKKRKQGLKCFINGNSVDKVIAASPCPVLYVMDDA